jgi:hypothetical protein
MNQLQQRIETVGQVQNRLLHELQGMAIALAHEGDQEIPAEWLDPGNVAIASRPTSKSYLKNLPRLVLQPHSALLWQATIRVESSDDRQVAWTTPTTLADWGVPHKAGEYRGQLLVRTKGDANNQPYFATTTSQSQPVIQYSDRGNGETFVQKARIAHDAGAVACLIGNHVVDPWPFFMQDSQKQATDLRIPTVLLPKAAAVKLRQQAAATSSKTNITLHLQQSSHRDCVICTGTLSAGETVIRLPPCGHIFHAACIEPWLTAHHTCPTCRNPLPTDDPEYDRDLTRSREASDNNGESLYG